MGDFRIFNFARDLDPLVQNREVLNRAAQSVFGKNGSVSPHIVEAQLYKSGHPTLKAAPEALKEGPFDLYVVAMTAADNGNYQRVLDDIALADAGVKVAVSGIVPGPEHQEFGVLHIPRPDGYLQYGDVGTLVQYLKQTLLIR